MSAMLATMAPHQAAKSLALQVVKSMWITTGEYSVRGGRERNGKLSDDLGVDTPRWRGEAEMKRRTKGLGTIAERGDGKWLIRWVVRTSSKR